MLLLLYLWIETCGQLSSFLSRVQFYFKHKFVLVFRVACKFQVSCAARSRNKWFFLWNHRYTAEMLSVKTAPENNSKFSFHEKERERERDSSLVVAVSMRFFFEHKQFYYHSICAVDLPAAAASCAFAGVIKQNAANFCI